MSFEKIRVVAVAAQLSIIHKPLDIPVYVGESCCLGLAIYTVIM